MKYPDPSPAVPACRNVCTEGRKCVLRGDRNHKLHICGNPLCECHSKARYMAAMETMIPTASEVEATHDSHR